MMQHTKQHYLGLAALLMAGPSLAQPQPGAEVTPIEAVAAAPNVLENGDFETLGAHEQPSGWRWPDDTAPPAPTVNFVAEAGGNHYALLGPIGDNKAGKISRRIPLEPGWKTLKITARVMGKGLQGGATQFSDAHIGLVFYDDGDKEVGYAIPVTLSTDSDWKVVSGAGEIAKGARYVVLDAGNFGVAGEFGIDDISVEPNAAIDAPPLREGFPEGTFEELDQDGQPLGWPIKGQQHIQLMEENGGHFLRLTNTADPTIEQSVETASIWKLDPTARRVHLRAVLRGRDIKPGPQEWLDARLGLSFLNQMGARVGDWPPVPELSADSDWRIFERRFSIPTGAVFLRLNPVLLNARGTFDIDEIQVEQQK